MRVEILDVCKGMPFIKKAVVFGDFILIRPVLDFILSCSLPLVYTVIILQVLTKISPVKLIFLVFFVLSDVYSVVNFH